MTVKLYNFTGLKWQNSTILQDKNGSKLYNFSWLFTVDLSLEPVVFLWDYAGKITLKNTGSRLQTQWTNTAFTRFSNVSFSVKKYK